MTTTLTDKYPQDVEDLHYEPIAIDVVTLEISTHKYYTMYNAFHHFDTQDQKVLIQKVIAKNGHLLIVEIVQPSFLNTILVTLASTIGLLVLCPLIKPFEWKRIFFTYVLPINLLTALVDGYISILKSKSKKSYIQWVKTHFEQSEMIKVTEHITFPSYIITIKVSGNQST